MKFSCVFTQKPNHSLFALIGTLVLTVFCLFWILHETINAYWQQTYHQSSPLETLEPFPLWKAGAGVNQALQSTYKDIQQHAFSLDNTLITWLNPKAFAPVPPPVPVAGVPRPPVQKVDIKDDKPWLLTSKDRVLLVGDSMMQGVAPHLVRTFKNEHDIEAFDLSKQSTGLAYPKFFDWPKTVEEQIPARKITLLIVFLGANDAWDMIDGKRFIPMGTPLWEERYRARVERIVAAAQAAKAKVIWLGAPTMKKEKSNQSMQSLNGIFKAVTDPIPLARFIPTETLLGAKNHRYTKFISLPDQGDVAVRTDDGIHFTTKGQKLLAERVLKELRFEAPPPPPPEPQPAVQSEK